MLDQLLLNSPVESHRIRALEGMRSNRREPKPVQQLIRALKDRSERVRILACEVLAGSNQELVVEALESAAIHDSFNVARAAINSLASSGELSLVSISKLIRKRDLENGRRIVGIRVVEHLSKSVPALVDVLADSQLDVVNAAVNALIRLGQCAVSACVTEMNGTYFAGRHNAAVVLSRLNWSPSSEVEKAQFLVLCGRMDEAVALGPVAESPLERALEDPTKKKKAALGLMKLGHGKGSDVLKSWVLEVSNRLEKGTAQSSKANIIGEFSDVLSVLNGIATAQARATQRAIFGIVKDTAFRGGSRDQDAVLIRFVIAAIPLCFGEATPGDMETMEELYERSPYVGITADHEAMRRAVVTALLGMDRSALPLLRKALLPVDPHPELEPKEARTIISRLAEWQDVSGLADYCTRAFSARKIYDKDLSGIEAFEALARLDDESAKKVFARAISEVDRLWESRKRSQAEWLFQNVPKYTGSDTVRAISDALTNHLRNDLRSYSFVSATHKALESLGSESGVVPLVEECVLMEGQHLPVLEALIDKYPSIALPAFIRIVSRQVDRYQKGVSSSLVPRLRRVVENTAAKLPDDLLTVILRIEPEFVERQEYLDAVVLTETVKLADASASVRKEVAALRRLAFEELHRRGKLPQGTSN